jgi:hypothetical protein
MDTPTWFLRKSSDGSQFGPITFEQLQQWAADAQISPLDRVSTDGKTWLKAPMIPELEMDYLIEVGPEQFYGPTTVGAVREFLEAGEISPETPVTNCKDATVYSVRDLVPPRAPSNESVNIDVRGSIRLNLQQRVRELEEALLEERRARENAEAMVERLEARLSELAPQE